MSHTRLTSTARQGSVLSERPSVITGAEHEPDIPAALLRAPCFLEILIPARNEARRLSHTLISTVRYLEAQPYSSSVVVIDNGSVDQTADLVARKWSDRVPVHLTGCAQPGKGAAVRRGILTSRAQFIGYMDADLATPIETLDIVVPLLSEFPAVVGSRRAPGATLVKRQPVHRVVTSMMFRAVTSLVVYGLADTQCGFKFFAGDMARAAARGLHIDGFAFDVELLKALSNMGALHKEIPVMWTDKEGSTLRILDGARAAMDILRLAYRNTP
jgi:glycosyltransferase involved in cell wall biosynthesis